MCRYLSWSMRMPTPAGISPLRPETSCAHEGGEAQASKKRSGAGGGQRVRVDGIGCGESRGTAHALMRNPAREVRLTLTRLSTSSTVAAASEPSSWVTLVSYAYSPPHLRGEGTAKGAREVRRRAGARDDGSGQVGSGSAICGAVVQPTGPRRAGQRSPGRAAGSSLGSPSRGQPRREGRGERARAEGAWMRALIHVVMGKQAGWGSAHTLCL